MTLFSLSSQIFLKLSTNCTSSKSAKSCTGSCKFPCNLFMYPTSSSPTAERLTCQHKLPSTHPAYQLPLFRRVYLHQCPVSYWVSSMERAWWDVEITCQPGMEGINRKPDKCSRCYTNVRCQQRK